MFWFEAKDTSTIFRNIVSKKWEIISTLSVSKIKQDIDSKLKKNIIGLSKKRKGSHNQMKGKRI